MAGLRKGQTNLGSFKKGNKPKVHFQKGCIPWNKGKKCPQISEGLTGRKLSNEHRKEAIKNLMIPRKGISQEGQFKMGISPWNKNLKGVMPTPWNKLEFREPYSYEFNNQLKEQIRARDNYECQLCNIKQEEMNERLIVHHIDFDKNNNNLINLISLCRSCHGKVHCANSMIWIRFFQNIQIKKLDENIGGSLQSEHTYPRRQYVVRAEYRAQR